MNIVHKPSDSESQLVYLQQKQLGGNLAGLLTILSYLHRYPQSAWMSSIIVPLHRPRARF
jgi:hypothetical protein